MIRFLVLTLLVLEHSCTLLHAEPSLQKQAHVLTSTSANTWAPCSDRELDTCQEEVSALQAFVNVVHLESPRHIEVMVEDPPRDVTNNTGNVTTITTSTSTGVLVDDLPFFTAVRVLVPILIVGLAGHELIVGCGLSKGIRLSRKSYHRYILIGLNTLVLFVNYIDSTMVLPLGENVAYEFGYSPTVSGILCSLDHYGAIVGVVVICLFSYLGWAGATWKRLDAICLAALCSITELITASVLDDKAIRISGNVEIIFILSRIFTGFVEGMMYSIQLISTNILNPFELAILGSLVPVAAYSAAAIGPELPTIAQTCLPMSLYDDALAQMATCLTVSSLLWCLQALSISILLPRNPKVVSSSDRSSLQLVQLRKHLSIDIASLDPSALPDENRCYVVASMVCTAIVGYTACSVQLYSLPLMLEVQNEWGLLAVGPATGGVNFFCLILAIMNLAIRSFCGTGIDTIAGTSCLIMCVLGNIFCFQYTSEPHIGGTLLIIGCCLAPGFLSPVLGMDIGYALLWSDPTKWYNPEIVNFFLLMLFQLSDIIGAAFGRALATSGRNSVAGFDMACFIFILFNFCFCRYYLMVPSKDTEQQNMIEGNEEEPAPEPDSTGQEEDLDSPPLSTLDSPRSSTT